MRYQRQTTLVVAALGVVGLAVAACGEDATSTLTTSAPTSLSSAAPSATPGSSTTVRVQLTEFEIQLPQQSFPAGTYTFVTSNDGTLPHALEIEGPGGLEEATDTLSGGQSADLTVTLQPGDYKLYCPVGNHDARGMNTTITVSG